MTTQQEKPRPLCLVCGKSISTKNCGFEKRERETLTSPLVINVEDLQHELEVALRERGVIE